MTETLGLGRASRTSTTASRPSSRAAWSSAPASRAPSSPTRIAVLYDEPTTGLDPIITHVLTDTIVKLREQLNGTAVVVSHDLESIYMMADYIAMLFEGAIIAYGTVDEIRRSPNPIVQQFLQGSEVGPIPI